MIRKPPSSSIDRRGSHGTSSKQPDGSEPQYVKSTVNSVIREAVQQTATSKTPLDLLLKAGVYYKTYRVDYHGGEQYPHLKRDEAAPDLISLISAPLAKK